jgi:hypothetical protein
MERWQTQLMHYEMNKTKIKAVKTPSAQFLKVVEETKRLLTVYEALLESIRKVGRGAAEARNTFARITQNVTSIAHAVICDSEWVNVLSDYPELLKMVEQRLDKHWKKQGEAKPV